MKKPDKESQDLQKLERKAAIELFIPLSNNSTELLRFMLQLEKAYKRDNHSVGIISMGGSFDRGTFITISPGFYSPAEIVNKISSMPEVETVEEDTPASGVFSHFSTIFARMRSSNFSPNNRYRITLNGKNKDRQKLEAIYNRQP